MVVYTKNLQSAERLRIDITAQFGHWDDGHQGAVAWIDRNIMQPAHNLRRRLNITYQPGWIYECRPSTSTDRRLELLDTAEENKEPECPPVRACFKHPENKGEAYFFSNTECVRITIQPGTTRDHIVDGPKLIINEWSSLQKTIVFRVDAALPNPDNTDEAYFFSGSRYVLINVTRNSIVHEPKQILTEWPSLRQAGFTTVDAVLPNPDDEGEAYFFSGERYVLVKIRPGTRNDFIVNGPKVTRTEWPSLRQAGFSVVEAAIPHPTENEQAYFFSGDQYVLINVKPGTNQDSIVNGPKDVATNWPSLHQAGFYFPA